MFGIERGVDTKFGRQQKQGVVMCDLRSKFGDLTPNLAVAGISDFVEVEIKVCKGQPNQRHERNGYQ